MVSQNTTTSVPSGPSSNWLALQKKLSSASTSTKKGLASAVSARKRRKIEHPADSADSSTVTTATFHAAIETSSFPRGTSIEMISGELECSSSQQQPGKYLALDCEMVGVGLDGKESSLARRERVVDYRTGFSGVRPSDMVHAKSFGDVQKEVASLLKDRILVGHAVHNDLKALLLSHPRADIRDTQVCAAKHKLMPSRRPALRHLVHQELGVAIQGGEHSSVTDARATMAIYRIHRKEWEKGQKPHPPGSSTLKRKRADTEDTANDDSIHLTRKTEFPGGGRKGVSSGLSTIMKKRDSVGDSKGKTKWWKELGDGLSKGSIRLKAR
ncbi:RNA exonuclease 4 [Grifola frondosa]|uniref:RNA exonuclease 4 n=1 Tax=Grifola frondosa TaxID=5627 RepID=A0A1C7LYV8_GRIFR|nr:RNA exonuclease 4 [Grifola frondosa]